MLFMVVPSLLSVLGLLDAVVLHAAVAHLTKGGKQSKEVDVDKTMSYSKTLHLFFGIGLFTFHFLLFSHRVFIILVLVLLSNIFVVGLWFGAISMTKR